MYNLSIKSFWNLILAKVNKHIHLHRQYLREQTQKLSLGSSQKHVDPIIQRLCCSEHLSTLPWPNSQHMPQCSQLQQMTGKHLLSASRVQDVALSPARLGASFPACLPLSWPWWPPRGAGEAGRAARGGRGTAARASWSPAAPPAAPARPRRSRWCGPPARSAPAPWRSSPSRGRGRKPRETRSLPRRCCPRRCVQRWWFYRESDSPGSRWEPGRGSSWEPTRGKIGFPSGQMINVNTVLRVHTRRPENAE